MNILAIDPGPDESAYVFYDGKTPSKGSIIANELLIERLLHDFWCEHVAIEGVQCFGMAVGAETFNTCIWIGRFIQTWGADACSLVYRSEVKLHLCHSSRAKDPMVRQALIDKFGPGKAKAIGLKAAPGPLYGIRSHVWSALAVAVTYHETKVLAPL